MEAPLAVCYPHRLITARIHGGIGALFLLSFLACGTSDRGSACTKDADCSPSMQCHPTARICVDRCHEGKNDCQAPESCDAQSDLCTCNPADANCGPDRICHPEDRLCVPVLSEGCGEACPTGRVCCTAGIGYLCLASPLHCSEGCLQDTDCDPSDRCDLTLHPPSCVGR